MADLVGSPKAVKYTDQHVLVFTVVNDCAQDQHVILCARPKTVTTYPEPWKECEGLPKSAPAMAGQSFEMDGKTGSRPSTKTAICTVRWPNTAGTFTEEEFILQVASAKTGPLQCPKAQEEEAGTEMMRKRLAPELALEVEP